MKIAALEKAISAMDSDMKNKFAAASWMSSLSGGGNSELLRMTADKEEEHER